MLIHVWLLATGGSGSALVLGAARPVVRPVASAATVAAEAMM
jgi:hypothetical protein